jgi:hypothetical protein
MMEIPSSTSTFEEHIPFVQAVCIDGELTDLLPAQVIVDPMGIVEDDGIVSINAEIAPRRSSGCNCSSSHSLSEPHEDASSSSFHFGEHRSSFHQDQQQTDNETFYSSNCNQEEDESQVFGAGTAGALLGFLMGGPLLAVVLGLGSLYCSQQDGAAGDIARAMGDVAILTGSRAQQLNEKHQLVGKGKKVAGKALAKLKEIEQKHHHRHCEERIKFRKFVAWCWKSLVNFEHKHQLLNRLSIKAKEHLDALVKEYLPNEGPTDSNEQNTSSGTAQQ